MSELMLSGLVVGILAIIFWTPYLMAKGVCTLDGEFGIKERILSFIPLFNMAYAEKKYYGKCPKTIFAYVFVIAAFVFRVWSWYFNYENHTLAMVSTVILWISLASYFVVNMIMVFNIINDAQAMTGLKLILFTVAYPFGQYYIGAYLINVINHMKKQEATFVR